MGKGGPQDDDSGHFPSGRVVVDDRGHNVWDWGRGSGSVELDSTTVMLKRLDNEALSLAETQGIEMTGRLKQLSLEDTANAPAAAPDTGFEKTDFRLEVDMGNEGGFDPYNSAGESGSGDPFLRAKARKRRGQ